MLWASNTLSKVLRGDQSKRALPWRLEQTGIEPSGGLHAVELRDVSAPKSPAAREPAAPLPDVEALRLRAYDEGVAAGREQGRRGAAAEFEAKLATIESAVGHVLGYKRRLREEAQREVVDLAFAVARRVVRRELSLNPTAAAGIVRACLDECSASEVERILVNPHDLEIIREHVGDAAEVVASSEISTGGAVFETKRGRFDARIEAQLEEIETGLADA